jgi:FkbM family methyltransferase
VTSISEKKLHLLIHSKDIGVGRRVFIGLDDEHLKAEKAIAWIKSISNQEVNSILDIGANIGHVTIPLLKRGVVSKAYCYEPDPENYKLLQVNLLLNGLTDRVKCQQIALTREDSQFLLELSEDNFGDHRIRKSINSGRYREADRSVVSVQGKRLDVTLPPASLAAGESPLLWLDVQGFESEVLLGGLIFIYEKNPPIALEFWPYGLNRVNGVAELVSTLRRYGVFYDLSNNEPVPQSINDLVKMFDTNLWNDSFSKDILLV